MTAASALVERLVRHGVRHVFGYPGGQLTPLYDALIGRADLRHFLARHEQAAAFMADGFARATGRLGVCLAVCGPGVYNTATALATSHTDSIPVLCLSGQVPTKGAGLRSGYYHENDQAAACRHFTKAVYRAQRVEDVVPLLDAAVVTATTGRPGPVLFEVPVDVLRAPAGQGDVPMPVIPPPVAPDVTAAVRLMQSWRRPLILVGGGAVGAEDEVAALASGLGAAVFHSANGKAVHPHALGMPWSRATSDASDMGPFMHPAFADADGLLAIGCRFTQLTTGTWKLRLPEQLVHLDIDPAEIGRHYRPAIGIVGEARATLREIVPHFGQPRPVWGAWPPPEPWTLGGMNLVETLRLALPEDVLLAADVTRAAYLLMSRLPLSGRRSWLHPAGSVAMGYALPAALGAKAAFPERPAVVVVGDGGLQMSALEMATAVQEGLPIVVVLLNDSCLTLIKATQERHYPGRTTAVDLRNPDFAQLAAAFGFTYRRAAMAQTLGRAVRDAIASARPALIEVALRD